jgi:hypothetical protein
MWMSLSQRGNGTPQAVFNEKQFNRDISKRTLQNPFTKAVSPYRQRQDGQQIILVI